MFHVKVSLLSRDVNAGVLSGVAGHEAEGRRTWPCCIAFLISSRGLVLARHSRVLTSWSLALAKSPSLALRYFCKTIWLGTCLGVSESDAPDLGVTAGLGNRPELSNRSCWL